MLNPIVLELILCDPYRLLTSHWWQ